VPERTRTAGGARVAAPSKAEVGTATSQHWVVKAKTVSVSGASSDPSIVKYGVMFPSIDAESELYRTHLKREGSRRRVTIRDYKRPQRVYSNVVLLLGRVLERARGVYLNIIGFNDSAFY
jgi:hypothetical protein